MPRPVGQPLRPGDIWHAACGRVYTPPASLTLRDIDPLTLEDWLDIHTGSYGDQGLQDFCSEQQVRDRGEG